MIQTGIYIEGKFVETQERIKIINLHDGRVIDEICTADSSHIEKAILFAEEVKNKLKSFSIEKRVEVLREISKNISDNKNEFATIISKESGKPIKYALIEAERGADTFAIAADECLKIATEIMDLGKGKTATIKQFPIGIIAGITPFNFPLNLVAHKVAPAIAAGCPIILKPSSLTPLTALFLAEFIDQTNLPKGALQVVPCSRVIGDLLVKDARISLLSFTGSPDVGWKMKRDCGKKKIVLELGGNAGTIINEDADIDFALQRSLMGAFAYSGQICIHAQRIYVHRNIFEDFIHRFIEKTKNLKKGNPLDEKTDIAGMIDEKNAIRVENWVNEAVESGAIILCGGKRYGNYFEPTILTDTDPSMKVNAEEIFGPVVCIEKCTDFKDGIKKINDSRFGLQAGVFTKDKKLQDYAFENLEVGGVIFNDVPTYRSDKMPYGGVKDSGLGREGVRFAMEDYLEMRVKVNAD